jgi:diguanylate cyclase (GGDEF)-like protein/PAS domain S-box-containing protein
MAEASRSKQYAQRFWNEITPDSAELDLPPTAWRHEAKLNKQIQVYAQLHLLQQLMDALPVCVSYVDRNRCYQYANITYQDWFGLKPEEIYGKSLESVIGTAAYQKAKPNVDRVLRGETVVYEATLPYQAGGKRFVQGTLVPDSDMNGEVRGYFALILDLSDRKAAELALQRKASREHTLWLITKRIRQTLNLEEILATAVEEVQRYLEVDRTLIFQFTSNHSGEIIQAATQPDCLVSPQAQQWKQHGLRRTCHLSYDQGNVRTISDIAQAEWGRCLSPWMGPMDAKSAAIAPILQPFSEESSDLSQETSNLWGFLIIQTCHTYRQWKQGEAELLQQVADQLAIAVQQSELLAQVRGQSEKLTAANRALEQANRQLSELSQRDELTQVFNRRHFDAVLQREWKRLGRSGSPLALIMFDVDRFKQYNDHHGHPAGDTCLTAIAQACQQTVNRPSDVVARYGGEEFAVILPNTDAEGAMTLAEQIRAAIRNLNIVNFKTETETVYVTASLGVTSQVPSLQSSFQSLIELADQALYRAKQQGRNRVVYGEPD